MPLTGFDRLMRLEHHCCRPRPAQAAVPELWRWPAMRTAISQSLLVLAIPVFCGCGSTIHMQSKSGLRPFHGGAPAVYVTNPEIGPEYEILKASGIYQL